MDPILVSGVKLMTIGMGAVFFFLTLLVVCTKVMSAVVVRYCTGPRKKSFNRSTKSVSSQSSAGDVDSEIVAAIGVAVDRVRRGG